ncbi:hypothetical protein diail_4436 [Diaporthe ilicicola]|nr:hypothetical protein diail_4436 [Diaporthe ilicicola]
MANLAALQESIHGVENPGFAVQKQTVRELFDSGIPFFTRPALEHLRDQLDAIKSMVKNGEPTDGQKFVFLSVTGQTVERAVLRELTRARKFGNETVVLEPCLMYATYQSLVNHKYSDQALCPLQICYGGQSAQDGPSQSLEDTRRHFRAGARAWQASEDCARLRASTAAASLPRITRIIAFACSSLSLSPVAGADRTRRRSAAQHALVLTLRDVLQQQQRSAAGVEIRVLAQDPAYTDADRAVLAEAGVTVVDDPQGFLEVDDESAVLSFAPNVPVRQIITDLARPAVLAWDTVLTEEQTVGRWGGGVSAAAAHEQQPPRGASAWARCAEDLEACLCDPESSRVRAMIREEYSLVQKLDKQAFGDASVYVRNGERRS